MWLGSNPPLLPVKDRYGLVILAVGALVMVGAGGFVRYTFPLLLPAMREGLGANYGQMGLLATGNNVGYVISSVLGGILSTRFGARPVVSISMLLAGLATFATGLSPGVELALAVQFLAGLAAGGCVVPAVGLAAAWFDPGKRGIATGIIVGGMPLGILASSRFLPVLLETYGPGAWRYGWMVMGALTLFLGLLALILLRDPPQVRGGFETRPYQPGIPGFETRAYHTGTQGDAPDPASPISWGLAYKNRSVLLLCAVNFCTGLAGGIFATFFVAYLVAQWGITASQAGSAWGLVGLAGAVSGLAWGYISDRIGRRLGLAACYYIFFISFVILTFVSLPGAEYAVAVLGGLTLYGGMTVTIALVGDAVGPRMVSAAFGLISLSFNFGQMISPAMAGAVTDATGSFTPSLITAIVFALSAASLAFLLPAQRPSPAGSSP